MKFSVLMSLYFKEKPQYLIECFESLSNQTIHANEIILVFDGPITNELETIVEKYCHILPLNIIRLNQNQGLGKALNEGLKHCTNEWVFRMDTDDICEPYRFEKQIKFILDNSNLVIVGGQIAEFNQHKDDIVSYRNVPLSAKDIVKFTCWRCPFNHMTVAYKKSAVLSAGGYQDLQEDYYLWINLVARNLEHIANLPDILVYARIGNGMVGRRRGLLQARCEWNLFMLKRKLKLQNNALGFVVFLLRVIPRLLPTSLLTIIYRFLRK